MRIQDFLARVTRQLPESLPRRAAMDLRLLRELFISRYQPLLDRHPWSFLHTWAAIQLPPQYATGTVSLTQGSATVTGVGTVWTATHVGYYLLVDGEVPLEVTAVASGTSATIEAPWGRANVSGVAYKFRPLVTGSGAAEIVSIPSIHWRDQSLVEKQLTFLDALDPDRSDTGDPVYYSTRGYTVAKGLRFEVWPYPTSGAMVRAFVLRRPTSSPGLADDLLFSNPHVLELGVRAAVFEYAYAETGQQQWLSLAVANNQQYERAVEEMIDEDRVASSWPQSTPEPDFDPSRLDPLRHDTWPL